MSPPDPEIAVPSAESPRRAFRDQKASRPRRAPLLQLIFDVARSRRSQCKLPSSELALIEHGLWISFRPPFAKAGRSAPVSTQRRGASMFGAISTSSRIGLPGCGDDASRQIDACSAAFECSSEPRAAEGHENARRAWMPRLASFFGIGHVANEGQRIGINRPTAIVSDNQTSEQFEEVGRRINRKIS